MKYIFVLFLIAILSSGCSVKQPEKKENIITLKNNFDKNEVKWFKSKGNGNIKGNAKFKSKNGELRFGEGFGIELLPFSLYTEERLGKIYKNKKSGFVYVEDGVSKFIPNPEGYHDTIKTSCDKEGNFEFNNLPSGNYYVIAFMIWENQNVKTGGALMKKIVLSKSESKVIKMDNF
jgi:Ca2+/Na+ antiporter